MILKYPPPASFLNFTIAKSGSIPVVSQSITSPIVPVGAITVACAFRYPYFFPSLTASSQAFSAAVTSVLSGIFFIARGTGKTLNS